MEEKNTHVPGGGSGWVSGPPNASGCFSMFPLLLLSVLLWERETYPETLVALGPQSALLSGC